MSDSEDDLPLAKMYGQTQDGSESSEMPDWIRNHQVQRVHAPAAASPNSVASQSNELLLLQTPIKLDVSSGDEEEVQAPNQDAAGGVLSGVHVAPVRIPVQTPSTAVRIATPTCRSIQQSTCSSSRSGSGSRAARWS
jgi:hypothetical protein